MGVRIEHLSYCYGEKQVLREVNLTVETGEAVGITGVSGGGKSTLLKLVSGLYRLQKGHILVEGRERQEDIRRQVAMVLQSSPLFPGSIRDNITCGHELSEEVVFMACEAAQLSGWIDTLPEGLDTDVGERGGKVSGGQMQRISIARAVAKNAPVILLDEPTSALDGDTSANLMRALGDLTRGRTVLHVSHRPEALAGCNRILRLEEGRLL